MRVACELYLVKLSAAGTAQTRLGCAAGVAQTHGRMQESDLWGALGVSLQKPQRAQATSSGLCRAWRRPC